MLKAADYQSETSAGLFFLEPDQKYAVSIVPFGDIFDVEKGDYFYSREFNERNWFYVTT